MQYSVTRNAVTRSQFVSRKAMVGEADGFSCYSSGKCVEFVASNVMLLVTMDACM